MVPRHWDDLQAALEAARLASDLIRREYEAFVVVPDAPASITTHVDRAAQEVILGHLLAAFPDDGVLAEEDTPLARRGPGTTGRVWVVDPIDGTRGFARKTGEFSVMIALLVNGELTVGVVAEPAQDRVTYATKGHGCQVRDASGNRSCGVTPVSDADALTLAQSHAKPGGPPKPVVAALRPARVVETYSAGVKLALVARGEADVYANDYSGFNDWDIAAGHLLVTEAGGTVTLFDGSPVRYLEPAAPRGGLIASNGRVHGVLVHRLQGI